MEFHHPDHARYVAFLPGFSWWTDGWRYVAVLDAIASVACVVASVAIARKSINAFIVAIALMTLSYAVIYHAIGFFGMITV